jgi:hypothetical protein
VNLLTPEEQARVAALDLDLQKWMPNWRRVDGLRYARWAVADLGPETKVAMDDLLECLDMLCERACQMYEIIMFGQRQFIVFFIDTLSTD